MARASAHTRWTVLPHGPVERLSERLWRVEGTLPTMSLARVMTIARRRDGGLVVHNAIAVSDAVIAELEAWGTIAAIVVPNGYHRLDGSRAGSSPRTSRRCAPTSSASQAHPGCAGSWSRTTR